MRALLLAVALVAVGVSPESRAATPTESGLRASLGLRTGAPACGASPTIEQALVCRAYGRLATVVQRLVGRHDVPSLTFVPRDRRRVRVAFLPCRNRVAFDSGWVATWRRAVGDAIEVGVATLLAHELGHYVNALRGAPHSVCASSPRRRAAEVGALPAVVRALARRACGGEDACAPATGGEGTAGVLGRCGEEWEADYLAGFVGHLAGYRTTAVGPAMLDALYASFPAAGDADRYLRDHGYPSLSARKCALERASEAIDELSARFDLATFALTIGEAEVAARLYEDVAARFPGPELLNDAGVAWLRAYLASGDERWALPLEWLPDRRLGRTGKGAAEPALLERARVVLVRALEMDPDRSGIASNLLTAEVLARGVGGLDDDELEARIAALGSSEVVPGSSEVLLGVVAARAGRRDLAEQRFIAAAAAGHPLGGRNLAVLRDEAVPPALARGFASCPGGRLPVISKTEHLVRRAGEQPGAVSRRAGVMGALLGYTSPDRRARLLVETFEDASGDENLCGLRVGDPVARAVAVLGPPDHAETNVAGAHLGYVAEDGGVVLRVDDGGSVAGWARVGVLRMGR